MGGGLPQLDGVALRVVDAGELADLDRQQAISAHLAGLACDFTAASYGRPIDICRAIAHSEIGFDQLIYEGSWVHVSFAAGKPRSQAMTAHFSGGGDVTYTNGIA